MANDGSVVKSFRVPEDKFAQANDIFQKEGFAFSEVIRMLLDVTIKEGRVPRSLSTREMESDLDEARRRENYVSRVIGMAIPDMGRGKTAEEMLLSSIFGEQKSSDMSNADLREWASKWGLPDTLSVATLEELRDCGLFGSDAYEGDYDYTVNPETHYQSGVKDQNLANVMYIMRDRDNLMNNLEKVKNKMQISAMKTLMESDNMESENENVEE